MNLSENTVDVLKNFSTICPSLIINEGSVIRTMAPTKTIFAKSQVGEVFPRTFAIYDLSNFLSAVSMFDKAELNFDDEKFVLVQSSDKKSGFKYYYANPTNVPKGPDKDIKVPDYDVAFNLSKIDLSSAQKASSLLNLPEISFVGDGTNVTIQAVDSKNNTANVYDSIVGECDKEFKVIFKLENIKMMTLNYEVEILIPKGGNTPGVGHFSAQNLDYWVVAEAVSSK